MQQVAYTNLTFPRQKYYQSLPEEERNTFDLLAEVFHFKVNNYVLEDLIRWDEVPRDPIYRLVFPRKGMISPQDFQSLSLLRRKEPGSSVKQAWLDLIRKKVSPHMVATDGSFPRDQHGQTIRGMYSNFPTIVSLFPHPMVLTCHSYCNYCFRWIMFGNQQVQQNSSYTDPQTPVEWLKRNPQVTDALFTGADPLVLSASVLKRYIDPVVKVDSIKVIRLSSKSLAYWPFRFTTDKDADDLLRLFESIIAKGKHLNFCAHFTHPRELEHPEVEKAVKRIKSTGAVIRTQGPLVRDVNDSDEVWSEMWTRQIKMGMIPYYMFMESDHHPQSCFRVRPAEALRIFQAAQKTTTGLARTVRGPVFMYDLNRVLLDGITTLNGQKYFVLKTLQAPPGCNSEGDIKLVPYDENAMDLGNLYELFNGSPQQATPSAMI